MKKNREKVITGDILRWNIVKRARRYLIGVMINN